MNCFIFTITHCVFHTALSFLSDGSNPLQTDEKSAQTLNHRIDPAACQSTTQKEEAKPKIVLKIDDVKEGEELTMNSPRTYKLVIEPTPGATIPKYYSLRYMTDIRGERVQAGEFISEVKKDKDTYTCKFETKVPNRAGDYEIFVEALPDSGVAPRTPEEKVTLKIKVKVPKL